MICPPPLWTGSSEMTASRSLNLTLRIAGGREGRGGEGREREEEGGGGEGRWREEEGGTTEAMMLWS